MTLVLRFNKPHIPVLMGDLLLSTQSQTGVEKVLPTVRESKYISQAMRTKIPAGLNQKVVLLGDNIAMGWSGSLQDARTAITGISNRNSKNPFTVESINEYLHSVIKNECKSLSITGFIKSRKGVESFQLRDMSLKSKICGRVSTIGSGFLDAEDWLEKFDDTTMHCMQGQSESLHESIVCAASFASTSIGMEFVTGHPLNSFYGAGYEIAFFDGKTFRKMDSLTYAVLPYRIYQKSNQVEFISPKIFRYAYINDLLLIRSVSFNKDSSFQDDLFAICPITRSLNSCEKIKLSSPDFSLPEFTADITCIAAVKLGSDFVDGVFSLFHISGAEENPWIKFVERSEDKDKLQFGFSQKLVDVLLAMSKGGVKLRGKGLVPIIPPSLPPTEPHS